MIRKTALMIISLLSGCTLSADSTFNGSKSGENDEYVDELDLHTLEQYKKQRRQYFAQTEKDLKKAKTRLPANLSEKRRAQFGSDDACLNATGQFMQIIHGVGDIQNSVTTLLSLLDQYGASYTHEYSLVSRECIALLLSHISRYFKVVSNGFGLVTSGILLSDMNLISEGFNKLALAH